MPNLPSRPWCSISFGLLISVNLVLTSIDVFAGAEAQTATAVQCEPRTIRLTAAGELPWWEFPATIAFTHRATGQRLVLEACWDGDRDWLVRFAAPRPGVWTWESVSEDARLNGRLGRLEKQS